MLSAKNSLLSELARQEGLVDEATLGRHLKEILAEELNNSSRSLARVLLDAGVLDRKHYNVLIRAYNVEVRRRREKKSRSAARRAKKTKPPAKATPAPTISFPDKGPPTPETPEPESIEPEPESIEPEPESIEPEPATVDPEPESLEPEPATVDPEPESVGPDPASDTGEPLLASGWAPSASSASAAATSPPSEVRGESSDLDLNVPDSDDQTSTGLGDMTALSLDSDTDAVSRLSESAPAPQPGAKLSTAGSLEELSDDFALELSPADSGRQRAAQDGPDPTMDLTDNPPPAEAEATPPTAEPPLPTSPAATAAPRKRFQMPDKIEVRTDSEDLPSLEGNASTPGDDTPRLTPEIISQTRVLTQADLRRGLRDGSAFSGTRVGDYVVDSEVARGGMGVVLRARPTGLAEIMSRERGFEGPICLKVILPAKEEPDPQEIDRFQQEVRSLTNLQHENIVRIFDSGMENELYFYAMELINGDSTRELVKDGVPPPPLLTIRIITECAMALAAVHDAGVLHRDIKPSNILIDKDASPYRSVLIDFGLVKQTGAKSEKGIIVGTPSYMPPEQARPRRKKYGQINPTSDLYSLGATFYYLLTGRPPFEHRDPRKCIKMVCEKSPMDPAELVEGLPRKVADICLKCLEKSQSDRYASASELIRDLQQLERRGRRTLQIRSYLDRWFGSRPRPE